MCFQIRKNMEFCFVLVQAILYVAFLILDITGRSIICSSTIKFSIIILCFCYALFLGKGADKSILFCMKIALLFTVISDLFLLIIDYYFYGVITFIIVQQLYGLRLILAKNLGEKNSIWQAYSLRFLLQTAISVAICLVLSLVGVMLERLLLVSVFYFVCITTNIISAIISAYKTPRVIGNIIFAVGMGLFLLCDINVGLFNLSGFITLSKPIYQVIYSLSSILMWTFYAPAQVLIAISTTKMKDSIETF